MSQKELGFNGDEAAAYAVKQVDPEVIAAYPITPQTIIVERYSEYAANGVVDAEFVPVESEHSALSCCVGASAAGARAYTATASNGLALMWEITYIAAGLRLPIVMSVANRALSSPLNIHNDHSDSMGARDSGWIQLHCENSQEVYDAHVAAWRIAEHPRVQLPVMVCFDGFTISHTMENVRVLDDAAVKGFVGKRTFPKVTGHRGEAELRLDPECPVTMGAMDLQDYYFEHRVQMQRAMEAALDAIPEVENELSKTTGRDYGLVQPYRMEDAEAAVVGLGSVMGNARHVVDQLRAEGKKAGLLKVRSFRPFPTRAVADALRGCPVVGVLDKSLSNGAAGGPLYEDVRAALYGGDSYVADFVHGLGGRDTTPGMIGDIYRELFAARGKGLTRSLYYVGLRE